jgi:hypothetical protein
LSSLSVSQRGGNNYLLSAEGEERVAHAVPRGESNGLNTIKTIASLNRKIVLLFLYRNADEKTVSFYFTIKALYGAN